MVQELIGIWKTDASDETTLENFGNTTLEFRPNGELIYTIIENEKQQVMFLAFEVRDNYLVTDQPSSPQQERTEFCITDHGLELNYDGITAKYIKVE